jgi:hypothetical protein
VASTRARGHRALSVLALTGMEIALIARRPPGSFRAGLKRDNFLIFQDTLPRQAPFSGFVVAQAKALNPGGPARKEALHGGAGAA